MSEEDEPKLSQFTPIEWQGIEEELSDIAHQLERIANVMEDKHNRRTRCQ